MAQKTIPQLNPIVGDIDENSLFVMDSGTQTFKTTGEQVTNLILNGKTMSQIRQSENAKNIAFIRNRKQSLPMLTDPIDVWGAVWYPIRGGYYVLTAENTATNEQWIYTARDGCTRPSSVTSFGTTDNIRGIAFGGPMNDTVVAVAGNKAHVSNDPAYFGAWDTHEIISGSYHFSSIAWSPSLNLFVAVSASVGGGSIHSSPDGEVWTIRHNPGTYSFQEIIWNDVLGMFFATTSSSSLMAVYSYDGTTWHDIDYDVTFTSGYRRPAFNSKNGMIIVLTTDHVLYSYNGVDDWAPAPFGNDIYTKLESINDVIFLDELGLFIACGQGGGGNNHVNIFYSHNGITWHHLTSRANNNAGDWLETHILSVMCWSPVLKQLLYGSFYSRSISGT